MTFRERHSLDDFTPRVHGIVAGVLLAGLLFFAGLHYAYFDVNVWESWERGVTDRQTHYAERVYNNSIFKTRMNTYSNYAFTVVGAYALALAYLDWKRGAAKTSAFIVEYPIYGVLFGVGCAYLGFASGLYHASLTRLGQQLDVASMYAAMIALIAMGIHRYVPRVPGTHLNTRIAFVVLAVLTWVYLFVYKWQMSSSRVLPAVVLMLSACVVLDLLMPSRRYIKLWALASLVSILVAYRFRQLDIDYDIVPPDTIFQGHSAWHILCAASLGLIYLFYRSEVAAGSEYDKATVS